MISEAAYVISTKQSRRTNKLRRANFGCIILPWKQNSINYEVINSLIVVKILSKLHALSTDDTEDTAHITTLSLAQRQHTHIERTIFMHTRVNSWTTRPTFSKFLSDVGTWSRSLRAHNPSKNPLYHHSNALTAGDNERTAHIITALSSILSKTKLSIETNAKSRRRVANFMTRAKVPS